MEKMDKLFELNKLPHIFVAESFDAEIVEDSMDKNDENNLEMDEVKSIFRGIQNLGNEFFTKLHSNGKKLLDLNKYQDEFFTMLGNEFFTKLHLNGKKLLDLNKYPDEGCDFGFESEALNNEVLAMLKIYLDRFY